MWASNSSIVKAEFVKFLQKLMRDKRVLTNGTYETLDLSKDAVKVVENFAFQSEHYPVIVVSTEGGQLLTRGLQSDVGTYSHIEQIGQHPTQYCTIGKHSTGVAKAAVRFTASDNFSIEQLSILLASTGVYLQGDLSFNLYEGGEAPGSGSLRASGSIEGFGNMTPQYHYGDFGIEPALTRNTQYWIEIESDIDSGYYGYIVQSGVTGNALALQDTADGPWVVREDAALDMSLRGDTATLFGGDIKIPVMLQIAAHDEKTTDTIFDIVLIFLELAKKYSYSEFEKNRIKIDSITFSGDTAPREIGGGNIKIYTRQVTVNVVAAWSYAISAELLTGFGYNLSTF